jgi:hypothetical protein
MARPRVVAVDPARCRVDAVCAPRSRPIEGCRSQVVWDPSVEALTSGANSSSTWPPLGEFSWPPTATVVPGGVDRGLGAGCLLGLGEDFELAGEGQDLPGEGGRLESFEGRVHRNDRPLAHVCVSDGPRTLPDEATYRATRRLFVSQRRALTFEHVFDRMGGS